MMSEDRHGEKAPLLPGSRSQDYGNRRESRRRSTRNLDVASIEAAFNKGVRPSLTGPGSYPITLSWEHINVSVKVHGQRKLRGDSIPGYHKEILSDINGVVEPGSLVAIMGARESSFAVKGFKEEWFMNAATIGHNEYKASCSGSGKSTLLNVLTNRNNKDYMTTGTFRLNGVAVSGGLSNISAYVQQDDMFIATLSVREHLQFRALLRMDNSLSKRARLERVEEVIEEMGLVNCANTYIGTPGGTKKGISGGEKKRLSFASEALTGPPIFFCDEPTSSLDSFMAKSIIRTLQDMARKGATILCTIHQPSSDLFDMFGHILLLAEGRVAFMGKREEGLEFFNQMGYPCPKKFNPADHYILTMAIQPGNEEACRKKTNDICDEYAKSEAAQRMLESSLAASDTAGEGDHTLVKMVTDFAESSRYKSSALTQLTQLFWRAWISQFRDPILFGVRVGQALVVALTISLIYLDQDVDQEGVQNISGSLFIILMQVCFSNAFAVLSSFPGEVHLVMREFGSGLYRLDTYYVTKSLSEIPLFCMITLIFGTLCYWMIGFYDSFTAFCINIAVLMAANIISTSISYLISIICGETELALTVIMPVIMPLLLLGGMFLNSDDVPDYLVWLEAISYFKYAYEILMVTQWRNIDSIDCDRSPIIIGNITIPAKCAFVTGDDVISSRAMDKDDLNEDVGYMAALFAGFYILAYVVLYIRGRRSRE